MRHFGQEGYTVKENWHIQRQQQKKQFRNKKKQHFKLKTTFSAINHGPLEKKFARSHLITSCSAIRNWIVCLFWTFEMISSHSDLLAEALSQICVELTDLWHFSILQFFLLQYLKSSHIYFFFCFAYSGFVVCVCVRLMISQVHINIIINIALLIWTDLQISLELLLQLSQSDAHLYDILWILSTFARYPTRMIMRECVRWTIDWIFSQVAIYIILVWTIIFAHQIKWYGMRKSLHTHTHNDDFKVFWTGFYFISKNDHKLLRSILFNLRVYLFIFLFILQMKYNHKISTLSELERGREKSHFTHHLIYCLIYYTLQLKRLTTTKNHIEK